MVPSDLAGGLVCVSGGEGGGGPGLNGHCLECLLSGISLSSIIVVPGDLAGGRADCNSHGPLFLGPVVGNLFVLQPRGSW